MFGDKVIDDDGLAFAGNRDRGPLRAYLLPAGARQAVLRGMRRLAVPLRLEEGNEENQAVRAILLGTVARPRGIDVLAAQNIVGFEHGLGFRVGGKIAEGGPAPEISRE